MANLAEYYKFQVVAGDTYLFVLARDTESQNSNIVKRLTCQRCYPLGGYAYDVVNDCFHVDCADYLDLGCVPVSTRICLPGWSQVIPSPESVLLSKLTQEQRLKLKDFKSAYRPKRFNLNFLQAKVV